jgi:chromosome partitioning protein
MRIVSFLHQKGGTGKSTLAIAAALSLAARGRRVLLLDTDYQGTTSEWGNRHGFALGVETRSQVQPIVHQEAGRFAAMTDWLLIDGPPSLSEMSESILRTGGRIVIPVRPNAPDLWALAWLAAMIGKLQREGVALEPLVVFNQVQGEDLAPLAEQAHRQGLPVHPTPIPADPAFQALFDGAALPVALLELVGGLLPD